MIRIALETGQNWRDIVRWNNLENPERDRSGPGAARDSAERRPLRRSAGELAAGTEGAVGKPVTPPPAVPPSRPRAARRRRRCPHGVAFGARPASDEVAWIWPTGGAPLCSPASTKQKNKGWTSGGKAGDPVLAAADGRVVYAGAGLRGYGNLIILKHNNTYLTAYAHNQSLLVKEDQSVRKGQKIAEMGNSDTDRVKLHFEIRRQGKPVDPRSYLPAR
jgi:lipoprotein NlpD